MMAEMKMLSMERFSAERIMLIGRHYVSYRSIYVYIKSLQA